MSFFREVYTDGFCCLNNDQRVSIDNSEVGECPQGVNGYLFDEMHRVKY